MNRHLVPAHKDDAHRDAVALLIALVNGDRQGAEAVSGLAACPPCVSVAAAVECLRLYAGDGFSLDHGLVVLDPDVREELGARLRAVQDGLVAAFAEETNERN